MFETEHLSLDSLLDLATTVEDQNSRDIPVIFVADLLKKIAENHPSDYVNCSMCQNFIGLRGDWKYSCKNPPENPLNWFGFLCYPNSPTCRNFKRKEKVENG